MAHEITYAQDALNLSLEEKTNTLVGILAVTLNAHPSMVSEFVKSLSPEQIHSKLEAISRPIPLPMGEISPEKAVIALE